MSFLKRSPYSDFGLMVNFMIFNEIILPFSGCVESEDRRHLKRRKRGCKSRHIHSSSNYPSGDWLTKLKYEKRQPADLRFSSPTHTTYHQLSVVPQIFPTNYRNDKWPAGATYFVKDTDDYRTIYSWEVCGNLFSIVPPSQI